MGRKKRLTAERRRRARQADVRRERERHDDQDYLCRYWTSGGNDKARCTVCRVEQKAPARARREADEREARQSIMRSIGGHMGLEDDLRKLEREDPEVAAAARRLDDAVERLIHPADHIMAPVHMSENGWATSATRMHEGVPQVLMTDYRGGWVWRTIANPETKPGSSPTRADVAAAFVDLYERLDGPADELSRKDLGAVNDHYATYLACRRILGIDTD